MWVCKEWILKGHEALIVVSVCVTECVYVLCICVCSVLAWSDHMIQRGVWMLNIENITGTECFSGFWYQAKQLSNYVYGVELIYRIVTSIFQDKQYIVIKWREVLVVYNFHMFIEKANF